MVLKYYEERWVNVITSSAFQIVEETLSYIQVKANDGTESLTLMV